jgi:hypothetical protein
MLKSRIHMAVAAGLMGLAAASAPVQAAVLSNTNTGQALIYPYYTVNGGWITTLNLMNTSDKTVAVKVRFREMKNSRDVLDFNIIMSPYDSWTGWVENDPSLGMTLRTVDKSCTSPLVVDGAHAGALAYRGEWDDSGGQGLNRLREGYVEVLVMGVSTPVFNGPFAVTPPSDFDPAEAVNPARDVYNSLYVPYYATHVDGVPRDCSIVDRAFIAQSPKWVAPDLPTDATYDVALGCLLADDGTTPPTPAGGAALPGSGYPVAACDFMPPAASVDNPLKGNVGWLNAATGYGAGSEAIAVKNYVADTAELSYVTAQQSPWFLEPTFATYSDLWTVSNLAEFENQVKATATMNEWADNPNNGARSDWVVTFPTKGFHVDAFNEQIQAASSRYRNNGAPVVICDSDDIADRATCVRAPTAPTYIVPFEELFGVVTAEDGTGISPITIQWNLFDREEKTVVYETDGTTISPAPPPQVEIATLDYEANIVQFSALGSVMDSNFPSALDASAALGGAGSGWALLRFTGDAANHLNIPGLPVGAFAIRTIDRTMDGQAYDAGYERAQ